jgi:hypothetical protein
MRLDKLVYAFILSNYTTRTVVKWLAIINKPEGTYSSIPEHLLAFMPPSCSEM